MIKLLLLLTSLIIVFYSCGEEFKKETCRTNSNCSAGKACYDGLCFEDHCKANSIDCAYGDCINGSLENYGDYFGSYGKDYYCECDTGATVKGFAGDYSCEKTGGNTNECTFSSECPTNYECRFNKCEAKTSTQECSSDNDCRVNYECKYNRCIEKTNSNECNYSNDCQTDYKCENNECIRKTTTGTCESNLDCLTGYKCNYQAKTCEALECMSDNDCQSGYKCDIFNNCTEKRCDEDFTCEYGYHCWVGSCKLNECNTDSDCPSNKTCHDVFYTCWSL